MTDEQEDVTQAWAELGAWGSEPVLNALDSLMWRTDSPPADSWSGVVVMLLDQAPDWDRLWRAHEWALRMVPRFSERVVEPVVPTGPPRWSPDPSFDLHYHLRRISLPEPASMAELLEFAQQLGVTPLDRERPPWLAVLVEGLPDGRAAYLLQCHHVLMDGAGATQLFGRLLSRSRETNPTKPWPEPAPRDELGPVDVAVEGLKGQITGLPGMVRRTADLALHAATQPRSVAEYIRSVLRVTSAPPRTTSPILAHTTRVNWRFGTLECPIDELKRAAKNVGGTVNDAFVSAVLGGLRHYHAAKAVQIDDVPISMPVSVRSPTDSMGGNRFAASFFSAPSSVPDPAERIRTMRDRVAAVRSEPALDFINTLTPATNLAPAGLVTAALGALTSGATLTTSSWLGVPQHVFMAGARFERMFVFGPLPGTAVCAALCTHVDTCCIGINVDGDVFTDLDALWASMRTGLDEVLELAH